jgi:hypothetical protein
MGAGRAAEAIALHEGTLKLRESKLGPDRPDTLQSRKNVAAAYESIGRLAEAEGLCRECWPAAVKPRNRIDPAWLTTSLASVRSC